MTDRLPDLMAREAAETLHPRGWALAFIVSGLLLALALSALDATIIGLGGIPRSTI